MTKITARETTTYVTTDGRSFEALHKAEAHQAALDIEEMISEYGFPQHATLGDFMSIVRNVLIYVPPRLWEDLRK